MIGLCKYLKCLNKCKHVKRNKKQANEQYCEINKFYSFLDFHRSISKNFFRKNYYLIYFIFISEKTGKNIPISLNIDFK